MAIAIWRPREAAPPPTQTFAIDPALLQSRAAQEARRRGVLQAKQEALRAAEALLGWGRLLGWGIIFVSGIHIWETVATIAPEGVGHLVLPDAVYHLAALGFTLMIDAVALFVARANAVAHLAGAAPSPWSAYFYAVTALLNAAFVASHAPALEAATREQLLPLLGTLFVVILPVSVPAGIVAVERSRRTLEICRLGLLAEVATLRELYTPPRAPASSPGGSAQNAAASVVGPSAAAPTLADGPLADGPLTGGRPTEFTVEELVAAFSPAGADERLFTPRELRERFGCSESSAQRLLQTACAAGLVERAARGAYRVRQAA
jgi:hypothetical protein